jgi:molybdopterin molybdotransferase
MSYLLGMAQLLDDCFAFGEDMLSVDQAIALIAARIDPVAAAEVVCLAEADGRILSTDIAAPIDLPPFANSAVDGYAVRHADLVAGNETRLPVVGRLVAGAAADHDHVPATALRIFTGAPMPDGADTVFMQEDVRLEGSTAVLPAGLKLGANRRMAGEDMRAGGRLLPAGRQLAPQDLALAAAVGLTRLPVARRLRVALFSTGNEIAEPGSTRPPSGVFDSNRVLLAALLRRLGAAVTDLGILRDDEVDLAQALSAAGAEHDLVLTSGGVSAGEADHVRSAVERLGSLVFWRIAIKPGRPVAMGLIPNGRGGRTIFVGLPGNPVAVFVTFATIVRALAARLSGAVPQVVPSFPVSAGFSYRKKTGRREYVRVGLAAGEGELPRADKHPQDGAGIISSLTETDGLIELAEDTASVSPGDRLRFIPYRLLM